MSYTDLENKEIHDLTSVIRENHGNIKIKDIDHIADDIVDSLYNDERVNNIYGKKYIAMGSLKKIFHQKEHAIIVNNYEHVIDSKLNKYDNSLKKRRSCYSKCVIV